MQPMIETYNKKGIWIIRCQKHSHQWFIKRIKSQSDGNLLSLVRKYVH